MSNYQTVNLPRDLAERIAKVCMFTMYAEDSQALRAILAKPSKEPAAWFDPEHLDFLTAEGRATTLRMGDGDRLARYTVPLYAAPTAAEELDSVRHWRGKHAEAIRERDDLQKRWDSTNSAYQRRTAMSDQLQADLTALDEKLDQTQDLLRCMVYDYRSVVQAGYDRITALGSDCDSVAKMLDDNPNYQKALALLLPDLESRPEERGTPETEPCSGCGTPGWTGACNKCVPY
ncbi:hypothetical protein D3C76_99220 [compost metagenome]